MLLHLIFIVLNNTSIVHLYIYILFMCVCVLIVCVTTVGCAVRVFNLKNLPDLRHKVSIRVGFRNTTIFTKPLLMDTCKRSLVSFLNKKDSSLICRVTVILMQTVRLLLVVFKPMSEKKAHNTKLPNRTQTKASYDKLHHYAFLILLLPTCQLTDARRKPHAYL